MPMSASGPFGVCCITNGQLACGDPDRRNLAECDSMRPLVDLACAHPVDLASAQSGGLARVPTPGPVEAVRLGRRHACALQTDGRVVCWGENGAGELGANDLRGGCSPREVIGLDAPQRDLAVGDTWSCAAGTDGGVHCWGSNAGGTLALGSETLDYLVPTRSPFLHEVVALASSELGACAISTQALHCWGRLGRRSTRRRDYVASTARPASWACTGGCAEIVASRESACVMTRDRMLRCWDVSLECGPAWEGSWMEDGSLHVDPEIGVVNRAFDETDARCLLGAALCEARGPILICDGAPVGSVHDAPIAALACDSHTVCAVHGGISCYEFERRLGFRRVVRVEGSFRQAAVAEGAICAVDEDGALSCAGWASPRGEPPP